MCHFLAELVTVEAVVVEVRLCEDRLGANDTVKLRLEHFLLVTQIAKVEALFDHQPERLVGVLHRLTRRVE